MFAKLQRQIDRKSKHKTPKKFRFDVTISSLEGIPGTIKSCRIVWTRGSRDQNTRTSPVINGVAHWRETLSQISTIYTDAKHTADVEEKEYVFKVQATTLQGHDTDRLITVGKAKIDMAQYAVLGHKEHETVLQMPFTAGKSFIGALPFGQLRLKISAHMVKHVSEDDELSEMSSGLAASTVDSRHHEQDLAGFPEVERSHASAVPLAPDAALAQPAAPSSVAHPPPRVTAKDPSGQGVQEQELQLAQQEVVALRARVKQLESDTHSSSSLEQRHLSLQQERDHMEHKLDELQQQGSRLGPANLANHDHVTQLEHDVLQLSAENQELEVQVQELTEQLASSSQSAHLRQIEEEHRLAEERIAELTQQLASSSESVRIRELLAEQKLAEERIAELEDQLNAGVPGSSPPHARTQGAEGSVALQARIAELEAQVAAMIEQLPISEPQGSAQLEQLESETAAAQAHIKELEANVEMLMHQASFSNHQSSAQHAQHTAALARIAELESQVEALMHQASFSKHQSSAQHEQLETENTAAQARIAELESQVEAMIEQLSSSKPQPSAQLQELETEKAVAQARIAELESQVEAMIEQIGSSAEEAVVALERDVSRLNKELQKAQQDNMQTHAAAAEAVSLLEQSNSERDTFKLQAEQLNKHLKLEQQKQDKDRAFWESKQAGMDQHLQEALKSSQRLQDSKSLVEEEHKKLQELHKQVMTELQQRSERPQSDLQAQLEASHAEVAHMQKQIAATTAALHTARASDTAHVSYPAPGDPDYSEDSLIRQLTDEMNLELEQRRNDFQQRQQQLEDQAREIAELKSLLEDQADMNASLQQELQEVQQQNSRSHGEFALRDQLEIAQQEAAQSRSRAEDLSNQLNAVSRQHRQELNSLQQQLEELQQQLQDSTHEVIRLESEAAVLDEKAVHLQMQLDEAQQQHANDQQHLQATFQTALQDAVQQDVAAAVSSRDHDLMELQQQLEEGEAHFQADLDEAHQKLLDSQNLQHKLEQQLRDSEAKRNQMLIEKQIMEQHLQETAGDLEFAERELSRRGSSAGTPPRDQADSDDGSPRQHTPSLRQTFADEAAHLKGENERMMEELVKCKMELAELNEKYLNTCHELHKAKEKNLAIAGKMTRLETIIYKHAELEAGKGEKLVQANYSPAKAKGKK